MITRRALFFGALAAPVIVRVASLMPVKAADEPMIVALCTLGYKITREDFHTFDEGISRPAMRDLLMPGLRKITGQYDDFFSQWREEFQ